MKEAPRRRLDANFLPHTRDFQPVERLHWTVRLALRRSESGEVMTSDQVRRALRHRLVVERNGNMPDLADIERRWSAPIEDAIEIPPTDARKARVPVVRDLLHLQHRDGVGTNQRIQPLAQPVRSQMPRYINVSAHRQRMHARIRPAR